MGRYKRTRALAITSTIIFIITLAGLILVQSINNSLEQRLDQEKLKSEALLSEKLLVEKAAVKTKRQLSLSETTNDNLDQKVKDLKKHLSNLEGKNRQLKTLKDQIEKKLQSQSISQTTLQQYLESEKLANAILTKLNTSIRDSVRVLSYQHRFTLNELNMARLSTIDYPMIKAVKNKKNKLTVSAGSVKRLIANVDVPAGLNNLAFTLYAPDGAQLVSEDGIIASKILPDNTAYSASSDLKLIAPMLKKVEITYSRRKKLKPGVYALKIVSDSLYLGSMQVTLK